MTHVSQKKKKNYYDTHVFGLRTILSVTSRTVVMLRLIKHTIESKKEEKKKKHIINLFIS